MSSEGNRVALIVACDRYADPDLKQLQAPSQDAGRFARILEDPKIGGFKVTRLINEPHYTVREKIDEFVQSCNREDTILFYFSCHGIKDKNGQLYFATITTNRKRLFSTGIESNFVNNMLDQCRAQQKVVLLDCCYSGAFEKGRYVRGDKQVNSTEYFGKGSVVITASDSMQYAFEGDDKIENLGEGGSYFTNALVEGLESGKADVNNDGKITYSELYNYIHEHVKKITPDQTPTLNTRGVEGDFVIFKNVKDPLVGSVESIVTQLSIGDPLNIVGHQVSDPILELVDKARALLKEKKYEDAVKICDTILMIRPEHLEALNGKGMALYKQKKYKEASECFEKVLKIKPTHSLASDYLELITERIGKGYHDEEEAKAAAKDVKQEATLALEKRTEKKVIQALNESTRIPAELIREGDQFLKKKMYQEAILRYDEVLKIEPRSELALLGKAAALQYFGKLEEAIQCYDKAIELFPNNAYFWNGKGHALGVLRKFEESIKYFDKAIELNPNDASAWHGKALGFGALGKFEESIKYYDKAIELFPNYPPAWFNKGYSLYKLGKEKDAGACFKRAKELGYG